MFPLINPVARSTPFDDPAWIFELKFDAFRAAADTVRGRLISRNGNRIQRFAGVLDRLPKGCVFDGELVVLDEAGRPLFDKLLFGRGNRSSVRSCKNQPTQRLWRASVPP
jgi:ATP-dependent DNA ligase